MCSHSIDAKRAKDSSVQPGDAAVENNATAKGAKLDAKLSRADRLRRFLEMYWLRPENAFWMALRSEALASAGVERPAADLCCGDGIFLFLHAGGRLDPSFDVFRSVGRLDDVHAHHADMFDHIDDGYEPPIVGAPVQMSDIGTDYKPALLAKARCLNFYQELIEHDANDLLPLPDASLTTVYCNAVYWVNRVDRFLAEMARVVQPGGRVILHVKLDSLRRYTLMDHQVALGPRFLELIGRGRHGTWPSLADQATWEKRFAQAGLEIAAATPFITRTHAHLWDVGLRPLAPVLVKMANALSPGTRAQLKREWVDLVYELALPFCNPDLDLFPNRDEPGEIQYVLRRR
jgi:SAM-dependent methyltransferase